jgi:uncharacterized protein YciI
VFLVSGEAATGFEREEVEKMQTMHLDNFRSLTEQGSLLTVGPCVDADKKIRGIVVLQGESKQAIEQLFVDDPFIGKGLLKLDVVPQQTTAGQLDPKFDPATLEEVSLVVVRRGESWSQLSEERRAEALAEHRSWVTEFYTKGFIGYAAEFPEDSERLGAVILRANEMSEVERLLAEHPLAVRKLVQLQRLPQYLSAGALAPLAAAEPAAAGTNK